MSSIYAAGGLASAEGLLRFSVTGVDFNTANVDIPINITLPANATRYRLNNFSISNASATLTTATFGLFSASGGGGTQIVTSGTACTISATTQGSNNNAQTPAFAITAGIIWWNQTQFFFRIQNPQGSAATADITLAIFIVP